ncbi:MAG: inositol monophosphatase family protein [Pseudomonadota bacterium]
MLYDIACFTRTSLLPTAQSLLCDFYHRYCAGEDIAITYKDDASAASLADRTTEEQLRALITDAYPDHGIIGEEFADHQANAPWLWVLDPLDGTAQFLSQRGGFASLIGLLFEGRPVFGAIGDPLTGTTWSGGGGNGQTPLPVMQNDQPVRLTPRRVLKGARVCCTAPAMMFGADHPFVTRVPEVTGMPLITERNGLGYTDLLTDDADLTFEQGLKLWDLIALVPPLREAGCALMIRPSVARFTLPDATMTDYRLLAATHQDLITELLALIENNA